MNFYYLFENCSAGGYFCIREEEAAVVENDVVAVGRPPCLR